MHVYFIIVCDVLQYNILCQRNFCKLLHLANTNGNQYNHCYLYSLGGRQLCQNLELVGLVTLTFNLLTSKWGPESPVSLGSLQPNCSFLCPSVLELRSST